MFSPSCFLQVTSFALKSLVEHLFCVTSCAGETRPTHVSQMATASHRLALFPQDFSLFLLFLIWRMHPASFLLNAKGILRY